MADRYLLESGSPDGYLLEDGSGVYSLDDTTLEIFNSANTTVSYLGGGVYKVEKTSGAAGFNADAVSNTGVAGDFVLRVRATAIVGGVFAGMNADPLTDHDFGGLDYVWANPAGGTGQIYEGGVLVSTPGGSATYHWIWRTGTTLGYGRGADITTAQATPDRTLTTSATLYFDSSLNTLGDTAEVYFYTPPAPTTVALTGQSLTAGQGQVLQGAPLAGQALTVARGSLTGVVSLALTGQSLTAARGSIAATAITAIAGQSVVVAGGAVTASSSLTLTGQAGAAARGSVLAANSSALAGQTIAAARGTVTTGSSPRLTGNTIIAARDSVAPASIATLPGQLATASLGSIAPAADLALLGSTAAVSPGAVAVASNDVAVALTGVAAFFAQGLISPQTIAAWNTESRPADIPVAETASAASLTLVPRVEPAPVVIAEDPDPSASAFTKEPGSPQLEWSN